MAQGRSLGGDVLPVFCSMRDVWVLTIDIARKRGVSMGRMQYAEERIAFELRQPESVMSPCPRSSDSGSRGRRRSACDHLAFVGDVRDGYRHLKS
jgi:hypothetical protein